MDGRYDGRGAFAQVKRTVFDLIDEGRAGAADDILRRRRAQFAKRAAAFSQMAAVARLRSGDREGALRELCRGLDAGQWWAAGS